MHGHARIELRDADTGKLEDVREDDNLVTDAVRDIVNFEACATWREISSQDRLRRYMTWPFATNLLGRLYLFDRELTEDKANVRWPSDAHLVATAGNSTNTADAMQGSINNSESGPITNGYRSVWDFSTSQANGRIKSLARSSLDIDENDRYISNSSYVYADERGYYYAKGGDIACDHVRPNGPLPVYAWPDDDVVANASDIALSFKDGGNTYESTPANVSFSSTSGKCVYAWSYSGFTSSGDSLAHDFIDKLAYRRIDMSGDSPKVGEVQVVKWPAPDLKFSSSDGYSTRPRLEFDGSYVWIQYKYYSSYGNRPPTVLYRAPASNTAAMEKVDVSDFGNTDADFYVCGRGDGSAFISNDRSSTGLYFIPSDLSMYRMPQGWKMLRETGMPLIGVYGSHARISTLFLGTINNIGEINKTPSQTMKVIYDLTDE